VADRLNAQSVRADGLRVLRDVDCFDEQLFGVGTTRLRE